MISFPNAKINLGLHVKRRRDDGFHDLETVFYPVALHDSLEIVKSSGPESMLMLYGNPLPGGENLCMKAYGLMQERFGLPTVDIHLLKSIPAGAGLGGGSSDAAHTLLMLNDIFGIGMDTDALIDLAAALGSDCPFFIRNIPVYATGRGELMEAVDLDLAGYWLVLALPDISVNTAEAYSMVVPRDERQSLRELVGFAPEDWKGRLINDFEEPVSRKYPEILEIREQLYQHGAIYASMSGSGSAVYGIFPGDYNMTGVRQMLPGTRLFLGRL